MSLGMHRQRKENNLRDEAEVRDRQFAADEPFLLREHALEDAEHAQDLLLVPLDRARDLLRVEELEPRDLAEVGAT